MLRFSVFSAFLGVFTLAVLFAGGGIMMRLAVAEGSYDPILDDGYSGTIDDFNAALLSRIIAACLVAAISGGLAVLTFPRTLIAFVGRTHAAERPRYPTPGGD